MSKKKICLLLVVVAACNNPGKDAQPVISDKKEISVRQSGFDPAEAVDIIGAWIQKSTHTDDNNNKVLDEAERQKEGPGLGFDYFLFKNDGSCLRDKDMRFNGTYDISEKNGERILQIQNDPPGETYKYAIIGPVNDEMVLHSSGAFLVFKKE